MSDQPLSARELAPSDLGGVGVRRRVAVWFDLLDAGHKLVIAGLVREVGHDGDTQAAYREWYSLQMEEHDRVVERMLLRMQQQRWDDAL